MALRTQPARMEQVNRFNPQIQGLLDQNITQGLNQYQNNRPDFDAIRNREIQSFKQDTIPALMNRFTANGAGQSSSGRMRGLDNAATNLHTNLAAQGAEFGQRQQALDQQGLFNLLGAGAPENVYYPEQPGALRQFGNAVGGGLGVAAPLALSSLGIGSGISSALGGLSSWLQNLLAGGNQSGSATAPLAAPTALGFSVPQNPSTNFSEGVSSLFSPTAPRPPAGGFDTNSPSWTSLLDYLQMLTGGGQQRQKQLLKGIL
jgi:hypothetical protein